MKKTLLILLSILPLLAFAEEVTFHASVQSNTVIAGKPFQLTYTVSAKSKNLRTPEFTGFEVLAGPYTSQSSSTQWINGQRTSSFTQTYTYTLMADEAGTFAIQPARITADGQELTSNGLKITVLPPDEAPKAQEQNKGNNTNQQSASTNLSKDNIFMRTVVSRTKVKEQECISLAYKLYFAGVDVAQVSGANLPEFKGFLKQEIELGEIQAELEHYNGRNYQVCTLYKTLLFPQKAGEVKIEAGSYDIIIRVRQQAQVRSIFDSFYSSYTNVTKTLPTPAVTIQVDPLPAGKPADFAGVGQYRMSSSLSTNELQTNDAVTLKLEISGNGNMKLLKTPAVDWPDNFEIYDPKVNNNFKTTANGLSGTKSIEYLAIPRASGDYVIPPITLSYYDTEAQQYRTLRTEEYQLHVSKAAGETDATVVNTFVNKEDIKQLGSDIRYISTTYTTENEPVILFGSLYHWLSYILPLLLASILFIVFHKRIKENADLQRVRYKKANKVAQKRLKRAKQLLKDQQKEAFYEELERAAWAYLSDRLSIPTAALNKDNIAQLLQEKHVSEQLITEVKRVLSEAEFARYAPAANDHQMQDLYDATSTLIDQLEKGI